MAKFLDLDGLSCFWETIKEWIILRFAKKTDVPSPSNTNPTMNGVASPGSSDAYSRYDHVHPSDTSKLGVLDFPRNN